MVFVGYETGTKGYRAYDPVAKKLHISQDVIFEEGRAWDWKKEKGADSVDSGFDVEYFSVVGQGTVTEPGAGDVAAVPADPEQEVLAQVDWSINTDSQQGSNSSTPQQGGHAQVEFTTPRSGESHDSQGVTLRFRTLDNIFDTTNELSDFEYSGVCYFAAEEPRSVDEVLGE
jgi:hypothetical protein